MPRRIIAVALPYLAAEARLRREGQAGFEGPFAVVARAGGALRLASVNPAAARVGLALGMGLADARALCPGLATRPDEPERFAAFHRMLIRWAGRFAPLVGGAEADSLVLDATGCAHLFGGEAAMVEAVTAALAARGITARAAMADSKGAAWALAHFGPAGTIAPMGRNREALAGLPVAALRLEPEAAEGLAAIGLGTIGEAARIPRGALARRFGLATLRRLDQALGTEPEPVAPDRPQPVFAARITLPEPIGLVGDVAAGLDRLLARLCAALETQQQGARRLRLGLRRVDGADVHAEVMLARPGRDPARIAALFRPKLETVEAGFGIDALRLEAVETEPLKPAQTGRTARSEQLADLIGRLGNRVGFERLLRLLPAESHIPERAFTLAAAAWSEPEPFPAFGPERPLVLFAPERLAVAGPALPPAVDDVVADGPGVILRAGRDGSAGPDPGWEPPALSGRAPGADASLPPARFRWRGRWLTRAAAAGPERIAPEWWWDDPAWRSGTRDYWRVATREGPRLWLFHTPQADGPEWWAQGVFP